MVFCETFTGGNRGIVGVAIRVEVSRSIRLKMFGQLPVSGSRRGRALSFTLSWGPAVRMPSLG